MAATYPVSMFCFCRTSQDCQRACHTWQVIESLLSAVVGPNPPSWGNLFEMFTAFRHALYHSRDEPVTRKVWNLFEDCTLRVFIHLQPIASSSSEPCFCLNDDLPDDTAGVQRLVAHINRKPRGLPHLDIVYALLRCNGLLLKHFTPHYNDTNRRWGDMNVRAADFSTTFLMHPTMVLWRLPFHAITTIWSYPSSSRRRQMVFDLAMAAATQNGRALEHVCPPLNDIYAIVRAAIRQDASALQFASHELRNDPEVVLLAVRKCGTALAYASGRLRDDMSVVQEAYQQDHLALQYASERCAKIMTGGL